MSPLLRPLLPTGLLLAVVFAAGPARAHIRLLEPQARYEITGFETGIKSCPCGMGSSNRFCNVAEDGSDPNRATDRVSVFEAGSTITVRFEEYVDHAGRFRVAFDPDGADLDDFNAHVLLDVPDPDQVTSNTDQQGVWELEVKLPDMTCDNCTLQLIQVMNDDTETPVEDPSSHSTYYACADIELVAGGADGSGGSSAEDGAGGSGTNGPSESPTGGSAHDPSPSDPEEDAGTPAVGSSGSSGGGCQIGTRSTSGGAMLALALGWLALGRRGRRAPRLVVGASENSPR